MPPPKSSPVSKSKIVNDARRYYVEQFQGDMGGLLTEIKETVRKLVDESVERNKARQLWEMMQEMNVCLRNYPAELRTLLDGRLNGTAPPPTSTMSLDDDLQLVDDHTIQRNILESRLALAMLDKTTWEFADLRARLNALTGDEDLPDDDLFRPQVLSRNILKAWLQLGLSLDAWKQLEQLQQKYWSQRAEDACKATNKWLAERGFTQDTNMRSLIRRTGGGHRPAPVAGAPAQAAPAEYQDSNFAPDPGGAQFDPYPQQAWGGGMPMQPQVGGMGGGLPGGMPGGMPSGMGGGMAGGYPGAQAPMMMPGGMPAQASVPAQAAPAGVVRSARAALGAFITRVLPASLTGGVAAGGVVAGDPANAGEADGAQMPAGMPLMPGMGRHWVTLQPSGVMPVADDGSGVEPGMMVGGIPGGVIGGVPGGMAIGGVGVVGAGVAGGVVGGVAGGLVGGAPGGVIGGMPMAGQGGVYLGGAGVAGGVPGGVMVAGGGGDWGTFEETRMLTRPLGIDPVGYAHVVVQKFSDLVEQHLPGFCETGTTGILVARAPSARLSIAMEQAQQRLQAQAEPPKEDKPAAEGEAKPGEEAVAEAEKPPEPSPEQLVEELKENQKELKKAAATPGERATIELVALLFQSILGEEQLPPGLRVWFARLQMPTLRVALAEPEFFSSVDHPARKLIDRMGGCVMGFEGATEIIGTPLEAEIKRVVQVVEAFPDTGKRVFQAVLGEFERFLERYYREQHIGARDAVSLAQKIEQRETLAIQYTIELRKLLNDVPVHERVRDFLYHIWADVLATTAVRRGEHSEAVKQVADAASDLVWAVSAKFTPDERKEVVTRLPHLLGILRRGMGAAGLELKRQEEAIQALVPPLQEAFSAASTQVIADDQLKKLKAQLEAIEEVLPEGDLELDESWVLDEAADRYEGLEVVAEGGSMPEPQMLKWAENIEVGTAFLLEYRGRREQVRLVWQGLSKQLSLFHTPQGRCVLFQKLRLAAYLQAGLMLPAQEESLTTAATRKAYTRVAEHPETLAA